MTYVAPELTLVGRASGVVLVGKPSGIHTDRFGQSNKVYQTALTEGEW